MARCKCGYDKNPLDTKTAFKVVIKGKNTYWCSEQCYAKYLADKEKQEKINAEYAEIYELTSKIFGYEFQSVGLLRKEVLAWEKVGSRAKIIAYLKENMQWLKDVMNRSFESDFNRVRYYSTIVVGKLHDWKPRVEVKEVPNVVVEQVMYDTTPSNTRSRRRGLADLEDDII